MQFRTIHLRFDLYGKAPAKYGANAYKVGWADAHSLARSGWTRIGNGRHYTYVIPPHGPPGPHPIVAIQVPTDDEILAVALRMHQQRETQADEVEGFVAHYRPSGGVVLKITEVREFSADRWDERVEPPPPVHRKFSEFTFAVGAPWSVELVWEHGDDQQPTWIRREEHVVNPSPTDK